MGTKGGKPKNAAEPGLVLTDGERELLVRILRRHRSTLPTYLLSMKREIELLDELLRKLAPS